MRLFLLFISILYASTAFAADQGKTISALEAEFFKSAVQYGQPVHADMNQLIWEDHFQSIIQKSFGCKFSNASGNMRRG